MNDLTNSTFRATLPALDITIDFTTQDIAKALNWAAILKFLMQIMPMILPLFTQEKTA
jgi:hypothetical protein